MHFNQMAILIVLSLEKFMHARARTHIHTYIIDIYILSLRENERHDCDKDVHNFYMTQRTVSMS